MGKLLFFDVDGTIWDMKNHIPDSVVKAFSELKKRGHKTFINTGRARGYVRKENLLNLGFDGIIAGCGTTIEIGGELLYKSFIEPEGLAKTINTLNGYGFRSILEGWETLYLNYDEWRNDIYFNKLYGDLGDDIEEIRDNWGKWQGICKFSSDTKNGDMKGGLLAVKDEYYPIIHNETVVEMVPHGHSKATGMDWVCQYFDCDISDTFAFGDSSNDREMIEHAGIGIAMGNGTDEIKAVSDYVTSSMAEDGIYNALKHFELI